MTVRKIAALLLVAAMTVGSLTQANAGTVAVPPAAGSSGPGAGIWISGTIIGIAAFLGIYDFTRRATCSGDFWHFGGPGFDSTITPNHNVLKPRICHKPK